MRGPSSAQLGGPTDRSPPAYSDVAASRSTRPLKVFSTRADRCRWKAETRPPSVVDHVFTFGHFLTWQKIVRSPFPLETLCLNDIRGNDWRFLACPTAAPRHPIVSCLERLRCMATISPPSRRRETSRSRPEEWIPFFNSLSRRHQGWLADITIRQADEEKTEARDCRLEGISSDHLSAR
jgi:hypothetical protein